MEEEKKLGAFDTFMLLVCGIMFADAIASNTSAGVASLTWWVIIGVLYMIPMGFVIGELAAVLPGEGGLWLWVREGLGPKWAALISWFYFACGLFIPVSSFIMCSDVLFSLIYPSASLMLRVGVAIVLVWVLAYVGTRPMAEATWLTNSAGLIKIGFFVFALAAGIYYIAQGNAAANDITFETLMPSFNDGIVYLPIILYCCTGMELAAASAEEMENPAKMLPKLVLGIAGLAIVLNIIASLGMLLVLPVDSIDLDFGLLDLFRTAFGSEIVYYVMGVLFLYAVFAQCLSWMVGGNRGACEAAKEGELPAVLGKEANGQPLGAIIVSAVAGSVLLVVYAAVAESASDLFYSLLSCGVIGSIVPYVLMLVSYQRLKKRGFMDNNEGFTAPAGIALSWLAQIIQCFALFLMVYVPTQGWNPDVLTNVGGFLGMLVTGLIAVAWAQKHQPAEDEAQAELEG